MTNPTTQETLEAHPTALKSNASVSSIFEALLKSPADLIETIFQKKNQRALGAKLALLTVVGFSIFGATMGSFSWGTQLWSTPLKSVLGIALSAVICLPSLYIFAALSGTSLKFDQLALGLAGTLALISALLLGFTPVLWVFSQSTESAPFFGFLVILGWLISLGFGAGFLRKMILQSGTSNKGPLRIWIGIFLFVTLQMSTSLRPFIGTSETIFTKEKRFFLEHWCIETFSRNPS